MKQNRLIRVAMIIQSYHPHVGGAERQLAALAPLLRELNVEPSVLTRRYPGLAAFELVDDVPVYRLPTWGPKPVASLLFTLSALLRLSQLKPDLIHAHELLSPTTTAVLAKQRLGVPMVTKVLRGGELGDVAKLQTRPTGQRRLRWFSQQVDTFIVISEEIDRELAMLGVPKAKRAFIPNGVDTVQFSPPAPGRKQVIRRDLGLPLAGPIAVFTGRLSPEKRIDELIAIWPYVREQYPEALLLIVGEGKQEAELKAMAGSGICFTGPVANVASYLRAADLFVLPSATEGLSNALLEAMASGLAVVVTAVGGAPDLITSGKSGWLIPPNDRQALCQAVIEALANESQRAEMGEMARRRVLAQYTLESTASYLRELYEALLMQPAPLPQRVRT